MNRIKRKIIKAGVELRVKNESTGKYESVGYYANKLEAQVNAQRRYPGKAYTVTSVRVDATPIAAPVGRGDKEVG